MADTKADAEVDETKYTKEMMKDYFKLIREECELITKERSLLVILHRIRRTEMYLKKCKGLGAATGDDLGLLQATEILQDAMRNYFQAFVEYYNTGDYAMAYNHIIQAINLFSDETTHLDLNPRNNLYYSFYPDLLIEMRKLRDIILKTVAEQ